MTDPDLEARFAEVVAGAGDLLRRHRFRKAKTTFHREEHGVLAVVTLLRSRWNAASRLEYEVMYGVSIMGALEAMYGTAGPKVLSAVDCLLFGRSPKEWSAADGPDAAVSFIEDVALPFVSRFHAPVEVAQALETWPAEFDAMKLWPIHEGFRHEHEVAAWLVAGDTAHARARFEALMGPAAAQEGHRPPVVARLQDAVGLGAG